MRSTRKKSSTRSVKSTSASKGATRVIPLAEVYEELENLATEAANQLEAERGEVFIPTGDLMLSELINASLFVNRSLARHCFKERKRLEGLGEKAGAFLAPEDTPLAQDKKKAKLPKSRLRSRFGKK